MGFQPSGVKEFIKLEDTPAAYSGQAGKIPKVNSAEDALEFATVLQPEVLLLPNHQLFNGVAPLTYTDLQLADAAGSITQKVLALIKVDHGAGGMRVFETRQNGETGSPKEWNTVSVCRTSDVGYIWIISDDSGLIEWLCGDAINVVLTLLAYIPNASYPTGLSFTDTPPTAAWEELDLGTGKCMALLKVTNNSGVGTIGLAFRKCNDTDVGAGGAAQVTGCSRVDAAQSGGIAYAWVLTDARGFVDWRADVAYSVTIDVLAYVSNIITPTVQVYDAAAPIVMTDLDLPMGLGICYVKKWEGIDDACCQQNGEPGVVDHQTSNFNTWGDWEGYACMLTDGEGLIEWVMNTAQDTKLALMGYIPA